MSVCELATLLKQFEQALPGQDVEVEVAFDEWDFQTEQLVPRRAKVAVREFKWGARGAVVVAEEVV